MAQFVHLIQFVETFIVACKDVIVCVPISHCTSEREQSYLCRHTEDNNIHDALNPTKAATFHMMVAYSLRVVHSM